MTKRPPRSALEFMQALWRLNHAIERLSKRMERALGLTAQQRMVIRWIGRHPGISSGQLAAALHLDAGTISTGLARMERKGLLRRRRDPADGRRVVLELTPIGRRLDRPTANTVESAVQRLIDSAEPPAIDRSLALLADLTEVLDATGSRKLT